MGDPEIRINTNSSGSPTLGSVTHSVRTKNFKSAIRSAKITLVFSGATMVLGTFAMAYLQWSQIEKAIESSSRQELHRRNSDAPVTDAQLVELRQEAITRIYRYLGAVGGVGATLIAIGLIVHLAPVAMTTSALALYLGFHLVLAVLDPISIFHGLVIKVVVVAGLVVAAKSAQTYQRHLRQMNDDSASEGGQASA